MTEPSGAGSREPEAEDGTVDLAVSSTLAPRAHRLRRGLTFAVGVGCTLVTLFVVILVLEAGGPMAPGAAGALIFTALLLLLLLVFGDAQFPVIRRFDRDEPLHLTANGDGIGGAILPAREYATIPARRRGFESYPTSAVVVRSPLFRRIVYVSEVPNFVRWGQVTAIIEARGPGLSIRFWSRGPLDPAGILHGFVCEVTMDVLQSVLLLALAGDADVHLAPRGRLHPPVGRLVGCPLHDSAIQKAYGSAGPTRLPTRATRGDLQGWFGFGPGPLSAPVATSAAHAPSA